MPEIYAFDSDEFRKLQAIKDRLYAPEPLSPDTRRDLANAMDAILSRAVPLNLSDISIQD